MSTSSNSEPPLYIFFHHYKTAGKSLASNVVLNLPWRTILPLWVGFMGLDTTKREGHPANPGWVQARTIEYVKEKASPQTRMMMGHLVYPGVHKLVSTTRPARYFTFLRHPVDRVVSLYFFLKYNSHNYWHQELVQADWSLEEWLEKSRALWAHNGQVRHLLVGEYPEECSKRELDSNLLHQAKNYLDQFWFVGLTETFENDSAYLYGKFRFYKFSEEEAVNVTSRKDSLSARTYDLILESNQLDLELYEHALRLRRRFFYSHASNYYWNVTRARVRKIKDRRSGQKHEIKIRV